MAKRSKLSKIGSLLGMESKARSRKGDAVDVAKVAGTKVPRMLFNTFGGSEIPILESVFSKWEDKRNKFTDAKIRKGQLDSRLRKSGAGSENNKVAEDMVQEARKSREDAHAAQQYQKARTQKADAYNSAIADQGSSQLKALNKINSELVQIKGVLRVGGRQVGKGDDKNGGIGLGSIWNLLPKKLKGKLGGKIAGIAEKIGGKRIGSLVKMAAVAGGAEIAEHGAASVLGHTAAEVAGSGLGAAAKTVAPEAAGSVVSHASGGILGKLTGFGKSAMSGASGLIGSGKSALGKFGGMFKGKGASKLLEEGVEKLGGEGVGKVGAKEAEKLGGKLLLKEGGKAIPLLGNIIGIGTSLGFAGKRLFEGDLAGAAMETGSGLLNLIPGVGNYLSIAADLAIAGRDLKKAHAAKKLLGGAAELAEHASKGAAAHGEKMSKTMKEVSEEGAKIVEEKADQGKEAAESLADDDKKDKKPSKLSQLASALNPIGTANAQELPRSNMGKIAGITAGGAAIAAGGVAAATSMQSNKTASPMERLAAYMAGLFDLASDDTKGLYVRAATGGVKDLGQKSNKVSPIPAVNNTPALDSATMPVSGPGTIGGMSQNSSASTVAPVMNGYSGGAPAQAGAASNGGWHPGHASGKLHFNVAAGQPGSDSSSIGAASKSFGSVGDYNIDQMWDQMKGTIAQGESGDAGYNAHHGGTIANLTSMTIGQLKKMKGAMGKYQLLPGTTLGEAARGVGLSDSDTFSAANQEAMGKFLFARRVKAGAKGGPAGIQDQLAHEWASLPKDASGAGAYDGDAAGNMAAGGSSRGQAISSIISAGQGSVAGTSANTANTIDNATNDVAQSSTSSAPTVVVTPGGAGSGQNGRTNVAGTGNGLAGPMVTRNSDSSVKSITQNFMAGSSAQS